MGDKYIDRFHTLHSSIKKENRRDFKAYIGNLDPPPWSLPGNSELKLKFKKGYKKIKRDSKTNPERYSNLTSYGMPMYSRDSEIMEAEKLLERSDNPTAFHRNHTEEYGRLLALANSVLSGGVREANLSVALNGVWLYEKLGRGGKASVKRRLLKAYENAINQGGKIKDESEESIFNFLERNSDDPKLETGYLEGRLLLGPERRLLHTITLLLVLTGVFFLSPSITGNAIGNVSSNMSNFIGLGFIILSLVILAFSLRRGKYKR